MINIRKLLLLVHLFFSIYTFSQESIFYSNEVNNSKIEKFGLEFYNLNYIKNNEYFNFIADGYTLLGSQIYPEAIYKHSKDIQIKAGVFILKEFGTDKLNAVIPTFSLDYKHRNHYIRIGNLFARNNHLLIEPMMASEKILSKEVIETGIQYQFTNSRLSTDLWMNWEKSIKELDKNREEFSIGFSSNYFLYKKNNFSISFPLQFLYYHRGGQINQKHRFENNSENLILNFKNLSTGIGFQYMLNKENKKSINLEYHFLKHDVNTVKEEFTFDNGSAHYLKAFYKSKRIEAVLGYFLADQFISAKGNDMFQSYSLKVNNNYWNGVLDNRYQNHTEAKRSLLFTKLIYNKNLSSKIKLGIQLEGFYQLNDAELQQKHFGNTKNQFDYSYGIYIIVKDIFSFDK
jgi:hypothetical protein